MEQAAFTNRFAQLRAKLDTSPVDSTVADKPFPLEHLLVLYIKTPQSAYGEWEVYFRRLYEWLAPIAKPRTIVPVTRHHHITEGRAQRYIAAMTSISLPTLQHTLKHKVYPMLGDNYEY